MPRNDIEDMNILILNGKVDQIQTSECLGNSVEMRFCRIFWFLSRVISSEGLWLNTIKNAADMRHILVICVEWILHDKNFEALCNSNVQMLLELFY